MSKNVAGVQTKDIVKYVALPGIIPQARSLFASGFGTIAFLMAFIYNMVRLLPDGHPYLNPANMGRFGIRHVIAQAANHLVLSWKNIDQIAVFAALLTGAVLLMLQFALLIYGFIIQPAMAQVSVFATNNPDLDIAFMMMDYVFGIPEMFGSCVSTDVLCPGETSNGTFPFPFHMAFHDLLQFYSTGLLIVGVLIFLYYVVVVVAETATTGSPFGQRFQDVWVPIRLVVAVGLLIPVHYGLSSSQYLTLYAAKLGSGFATNGWLRFNETIANGDAGAAVFPSGAGANPTGERVSLIALPKVPQVSPLVQFMSLAHACAISYWKYDQTEPRHLQPGARIQPYFVKRPNFLYANQDPYMLIQRGTTYEQALDFYNRGDVIIRFGERSEDKYPNEKGNVAPLCGEIRIKIGVLKQYAEGVPSSNYIGAELMQYQNYNLVLANWFGSSFGSTPIPPPIALLANSFIMGCDPNSTTDCAFDERNKEYIKDVINTIQAHMNAAAFNAWRSYAANQTETGITQEMLNRGWGGAGIWFNKISEINGAFADAVFNIPEAVSFPAVMEQVQEAKRAMDSDFSTFDRFDTHLSNGEPLRIIWDGHDGARANELNRFYQFFLTDNNSDEQVEISNNVFEATMNAIFGTEGLFAMREENAHIHPMAQLSALGKGMVDGAVRNVLGSSGLAFMGGILSGHLGTAANLASGLLNATAFIGLTAGLVLFYVLPFMPFIYFFFAVGAWIKAIFEAMVGAPLWALAHLRLDGEGLPGQAASAGYFLLLDIFIRPLLTVAGLIGALLVFTMQVRILNFIWDIVIDNLTSMNGDTTISAMLVQINRGIIDQFFFTVTYAVIVYLLATASFKMINTVPNNILRWAQGGVSTFADLNQDSVESLNRYAALGGLTVGQQATAGIREFAAGTGGILGSALRPRASGPARGGPPPGEGE